MTDPKIDDEVAKQLGREMFGKKQITLASEKEMMARFRKLNLVAVEAPALYGRIRLLVGRRGPITKGTREKLVACFLKLDELERE